MKKHGIFGRGFGVYGSDETANGFGRGVVAEGDGVGNIFGAEGESGGHGLVADSANSRHNVVADGAKTRHNFGADGVRTAKKSWRVAGEAECGKVVRGGYPFHKIKRLRQGGAAVFIEGTVWQVAARWQP